MVTTTVLWRGRQASLGIGAVISSVDTDDTVYEQFASTPTDLSGWIKDFTISAGSSDVELVNTIGEASTAFQNQILEQKPWDIIEISGTAVYSAISSDAGFSQFMSTSGATSNTDWKRYQFGAGLGDAVNKRGEKAIGIRFTDQGGVTQGVTDAIDIVLNGGYFTKIGDIKVTSDGHAEVSFTFKGLIKNYYEELNNS